MTALYINTVTDTTGKILNGSTVTVYDEGTLNLSTITDRDGAGLANPFLSGYVKSEGEIEFSAANGLYDIKVVTGAEIDWLKRQSLDDPSSVYPISVAVVTTDTTASTSIITGSIIGAGGLGITGAAWIGGLLNVAGAITAQLTLAVTGLFTASGGIKEPVTTLTDANETLTYAGDHRYAAAASKPSASRNKTLPTTNVIEGTQIRIVNKAAFDYVVKSSDASTIVTFQNGMVMIEALQDAPTTSAHWAVRENSTSASGSSLTEKIIEIGDWNMDTTALVNVAHGLTATDIRSIKVTVRNDFDGGGEDLNFTTMGATGNQGYYTDSTNVVLQRGTGGRFDSTAYNSTSFNRGWIIIKHV